MAQTNLFIMIHRTFIAPRDAVFQAWTQSTTLERWFHPAGQTIRIAELDSRVGGTYRFDFTSGGSETGSVWGEYKKNAPPEKLVFTWTSRQTEDAATQVSVEFVARGGSTEIWLMHEGLATDELRAEHKAAWESMLDQLASLF